MFEVNESDISCGVCQLHDLEPYHLETVKEWNSKKQDYVGKVSDRQATHAEALALTLNNMGVAPSYIFSDIVKLAGVKQPRKGNGDKVAEAIRKHRLGRLISTVSYRNTSTGNTIKTWVWVVTNREKVRGWASSVVDKLEKEGYEV